MSRKPGHEQHAARNYYTPRPFRFGDREAARFAGIEDHPDGSRMLVELTPEHRATVRDLKRDEVVAVRDIPSGLLIGVRKADCGAACFCAASFIVLEHLTGCECYACVEPEHPVSLQYVEDWRRFLTGEVAA